MLVIVRVFVIEGEPAVGIVALLETFFLNAQERIDETGAGGLLLGGEEQGAIDFATGVGPGR